MFLQPSSADKLTKLFDDYEISEFIEEFTEESEETNTNTNTQRAHNNLQFKPTQPTIPDLIFKPSIASSLTTIVSTLSSNKNKLNNKYFQPKDPKLRRNFQNFPSSNVDRQKRQTSNSNFEDEIELIGSIVNLDQIAELERIEEEKRKQAEIDKQIFLEMLEERAREAEEKKLIIEDGLSSTSSTIATQGLIIEEMEGSGIYNEYPALGAEEQDINNFNNTYIIPRRNDTNNTSITDLPKENSELLNEETTDEEDQSSACTVAIITVFTILAVLTVVTIVTVVLLVMQLLK